MSSLTGLSAYHAPVSIFPGQHMIGRPGYSGTSHGKRHGKHYQTGLRRLPASHEAAAGTEARQHAIGRLAELPEADRRDTLDALADALRGLPLCVHGAARLLERG